MIEMVDSNKNGTVDFPEFLKMMTTMMEAVQTPGDQDEDISQAFKVFDKVKKVSYVIDWKNNDFITLLQDGDGLITAAEIKETMMVLGENLSEAEVGDMVR